MKSLILKKIIICTAFVIFYCFNLHSAIIKFSQKEFSAGDLIKVTVHKSSTEKWIKVLENGKRRVLYSDKSNPGYGIYIFYTGFDVEFSVSRVTFTIITDKKTFKVTRNVKILKKKVTGKVVLKTQSSKKILSDKKTMGNENRFFHKFFNVETRIQYWREPWLNPLPGKRISSAYGKLRSYNDGRKSYHRGTDFSAVIGTKVRASNTGIVVYAGKKIVRGNIVVIDHGSSMYSSYWHLNKVLIKSGKKVYKGQVIGEVGQTGLATGPHLHWEIRIRNTCIDGNMLFN